MKFSSLIALIAIFLSAKTYAISFEVIGACSETPVYSGNYEINDLSINAGKASVAIFEQEKVPYIGNETGFNSILNTPTGIESIEVISETKMRAYGWCYSVNGVGPEVIAGEFLFSSNNDKLSWFYAYSTYENGVWLDYCVPSYTIKAPQFCPNKNADKEANKDSKTP